MNITLESLGLTKKEIIDLVVERLVESVVDEEGDISSQIQTEYKKRIKDSVFKIADEQVSPKVEELLAATTFQETNRWGESSNAKMTMKEYLIKSAEEWMTEKVNYAGKSKGEDSYSWIPHGTRISHMIHEHLQYHIESSVKSALKDINSKIAVGIQECVKIQIKETLDKLTVTASVK